MTIENHFTSLQLSQRLEKLGVPEDCEFYWAQCKNTNKKVIYHSDFIHTQDSWPHPKRICSAYLATELTEFFPPNTAFAKDKDQAGYGVSCLQTLLNKIKPIGYFKNSADCCATILIKLIENKIIKVEDLK